MTAKAGKSAVSKVVIKQVRSGNRCPRIQRRTLAALGLGRIGKTKNHGWTETVQGMVRSVTHLVEVTASNDKVAK